MAKQQPARSASQKLSHLEWNYNNYHYQHGLGLRQLVNLWCASRLRCNSSRAKS